MKKTGQYDKLDAAIIRCIKGGMNTLASLAGCRSQASVVAISIHIAQGKTVYEKPAWRYIDSRLQALRKRGVISYGGGVWHVDREGGAL